MWAAGNYYSANRRHDQDRPAARPRRISTSGFLQGSCRHHATENDPPRPGRAGPIDWMAAIGASALMAISCAMQVKHVGGNIFIQRNETTLGLLRHVAVTVRHVAVTAPDYKSTARYEKSKGKFVSSGRLSTFANGRGIDTCECRINFTRAISVAKAEHAAGRCFQEQPW